MFAGDQITLRAKSTARKERSIPYVMTAIMETVKKSEIRAIEISEHAKEMLRERIGCRPEKFQKLARKALKSKENILKGEISKHRFYLTEKYPGKKIIYRKLMGKIFIFIKLRNHDRLITVTPLKARRYNRKKRLIYSQAH